MVYKVKPGQDYIDIAVELGLNPTGLQQLNNYNLLSTGQTIQTPSKSMTETATKPTQTTPVKKLTETATKPTQPTTVKKMAESPLASPTTNWNDVLNYYEPTSSPPPLSPTETQYGSTWWQSPSTPDRRERLDRRDRGVRTSPDVVDIVPSFLTGDAPEEIKTFYNKKKDKGSGTFTQTNIDLWKQYMNSPETLSQQAMGYIDNTIAGWQDPITGEWQGGYGDVYNMAAMDMLTGQQGVDGSWNAVPFPTAILPQVDVANLDPAWYEEWVLSGELAALGFTDPGDIAALWLAQFGYDFAESGQYMEVSREVRDQGAPTGSGSSGYGYGGYSGGGGGGGGGGGYKPGYGNQSYRNVLSGLVNWRGVSYA